MPQAEATRKRCAIYTRKSSEEGLEQEFNSLQAQHEACEAYIRSQQHEGRAWTRPRYDDGGFSDGNLGRPALQQLLTDIRAGRIDIVVVYKVDRLTRSLADFRRTGSRRFRSPSTNTTSSMGRLTLNVLSCPFERGPGERIRDKIAASKKRGMRMGGKCRRDASERTLVINPAEAETGAHIFALYLSSAVCAGSSRSRPPGPDEMHQVNGTERGGKPFARAFLRAALNRSTRSVAHKGELYPGSIRR
jgi:DNA invertase Pin-like site-specific DNA recombinase